MTNSGTPAEYTVLITGASGFVGVHLAKLLRESTKGEIVGVQAKPGLHLDGVIMLGCDLLDAQHTARVIERYRPDVIFHLAAQAYVPKAVANPSETLVTNAVAQVNVLEACRSAGIDPIVLIVSSAEVYGEAPPGDIPIDEEQPFRPRNPYAVSKVTQDMLGLQYFLAYGMQVVRVRPFNHIGPGQNDRFVLSNLARQIAEIELGLADPVLLVGNLDAVRDFLDVRDVVRAYVAVAQPRFVGDVFNVASGLGTSISHLLERLMLLSGKKVMIKRDPARLRPSDTSVLIGDATKLRNATGWAPSISIEQSVADTLAYWRARLAKKL